MAISSPGLGSNLDVNSIITQLMTIEQQPLVVLAQKEASFQSKISAVGTLKGALSTLQSAATALSPSTTQTAAEKFTVFKTSLADSTLASASAGTGATAGSYTLEISALAKAQRLTSAANPTIANGTLTLEIGTYDLAALPSPTFTRKTGTSAVNITIDSSNNTIEGVRDAINAAKAGVTATIVNGASGKQLILESGTTGTQSALRLTGTAGVVFDAASPGSNTLSETVTAQNAALKINGIAIGSQSNTVTGAIDGLTVTLLKGPEAPATSVSTTLTVSRDTSSLTTSLNALIKAYNDANKSIKDLGAYNADTKKAAILNGDSTLRSVQTIIRGSITGVPSGVSTAFQRLSDLGISVQSDGSLKLDTTKLNAALASDFSAVANSVTAYGASIKKAAEALTSSTGILNARTDGLNASIKSLDRQRDVLGLRLTQTETRLRRQFTSLDTLISGLTKTSNFLQQQLANLPKIG